MSKNKTDLRIIKTKKKLSEALFSLLEVKNYEEIKISDLCIKAGVSRATFYNNFLTIDDVLNYHFKSAEENVKELFMAQLKENDYSFSTAYRYLIHAVVSTIVSEKEKIVSILSKNTLSQVYMGIQMFNNDCTGFFVDLVKDELKGVSAGLLSSYLAGASTGVLFYLLQHSEEIDTSDDIEEKIYTITTPIFKEITKVSNLEKKSLN